MVSQCFQGIAMFSKLFPKVSNRGGCDHRTAMCASPILYLLTPVETGDVVGPGGHATKEATSWHPSGAGSRDGVLKKTSKFQHLSCGM